MNKLIRTSILAGAYIFFAFPAFAGSAGSSSNSNSNANSGSSSVAGVHIQNNSATKLKTVGTAVAPGLIAGGLSCAGSTSVAAGFMGGAFAFGTTMMDKDCNTRENSKMFGIMGDRPMAVEILCDSPQVLAADARLGGGRCIRNRSQPVGVIARMRAPARQQFVASNTGRRDIKKTPYP